MLISTALIALAHLACQYAVVFARPTVETHDLAIRDISIATAELNAFQNTDKSVYLASISYTIVYAKAEVN